MAGRRVVMVRRRKLVLTGELRGFGVVTQDGQQCGQVEDFLVDMETLRVAYAVLQVERAQAGGEQVYPVPCDVLRLSAKDRVFVLRGSRQTLERAPAFSRRELGTLMDPDTARRVHAHFTGFAFPQAA